MYAPVNPDTIPKMDLPPYKPPQKAIEWNMQTRTFAFSIFVQAVALGLSIYALTQSGGDSPKPDLLVTILILELVVQGVELAWYAVVGLVYYCGRSSIGVEYRYLDWMVTTPTMLVSILLFVWYLQCNLYTFANITADNHKVLMILVSLVLNWIMLAIGYAYEARIQSWTSTLDRFVGKDNGLTLGFFPFLGSYVPIFLAVAQKPDSVSVFVSIFTFFIWLLYGVVAVLYRAQADAELKNTFYNLLDIVSKNIAGISVGIVTLMYEAQPVDTSLPLCNVTSS